MRLQKIFIVLLSLLFVGLSASESFAVSEAAALYLRIAPGARAAGMGEAYVAISDDATASHWNPAGLGASPLAGSWNVNNIPVQFQPITALTTLKSRSGSDFNSFDVWALSSQGLIRYDGKKWHDSEIFVTKTSHTLEKIVINYVKYSDQERTAEIIKIVAADNNREPMTEIENLFNNITAALPENYKDIEGIKNGFDTLRAAFDLCLINWNKYDLIEKAFTDGMKDEVLSESECDKINFATEKAKNRFIPEEITINFSSFIEGEFTALNSINENVFVGTDNGLFHFNGHNWKHYTTENGLPSLNVITVYALGTRLIVGTDKGAAKFDNLEFVSIDLNDELPEGKVTALGGTSPIDYYLVLDQKFYHFNGQNWSDKIRYTTVLDDTPAKIAERFAIYGNAEEIDYIINNISIVPSLATIKAPVVQADSGAAEEDDEDAAEEDDEVNSDDAEAEVVLTPDYTFEAGTKIMVPMANKIKGEINDIHIDLKGSIWVGTEYGVLYFTNYSWRLVGYRDITIETEMSFDSMMTTLGAPRLKVEEYRHLVADMNGLDQEEMVTAGTVIKQLRLGAPFYINSISSRGSNVYIATRMGLYLHNGNTLTKVNEGDLRDRNVMKAIVLDSEMWFATSDKLVTRGDGQTDISMMFAKWLPELSDDIYYFFLSGAHSIEGLGTIGANITYISYGIVNRTDASGQPLGTFEPYDFSITASYGTSLTKKLKGGISFRYIHSELSSLGAGKEKGEGTADGVALDFGLLFQQSPRLTFGLAVTNLGPDVSYIDASQSDPLPRNVALGFAFKVLQSDYYHLLMTTEANKSLVTSPSQSFTSDIIYNGGFEFMYNKMFAIRAGYIYDDVGDVKTVTLGVGLSPVQQFTFDFAYIPNSTDAPLANTLRTSLQIKF